MTGVRRVVLDTNVFVAAAFSRESASARLLREVESGRLVLVWSRQTRDETKSVLGRIPRLSWDAVASFFDETGRFEAELDLAPVGFVDDPADRKFAALSLASGAPLVSADDDLLAHRARLNVWTAGAFLKTYREQEGKR